MPFRKMINDFRENPKAFRVMLRSFFLMGWGQLKNKQKFKGYPLLILFLIYFLTELLTSGYWFAFGEMQYYPAGDGPLYFFRDYGGIFTSGIWGFITLGRIVAFDSYRGMDVRLNDNVLPWNSADVSTVLLGEGILILVLIGVLLAIWIFQMKDAYETAKKVEAGEPVNNWKEYRNRMFDDFFPYLIIIPAAILILFISLVPFLYSFLIAFTNYTSKISVGGELIEWVGFQNFGTYLFQPEWLQFFGQVIGWTILWAIMSSVTVYVVGFIQALVVESKSVKHKKFWRVVMILPWAIPGLVSLMVFRNVFSENGGLMNTLLVEFGQLENVKTFLRGVGLLGQEHSGVILWYTDPMNGPLAKAIIVVTNMWLGSPYFMLLIVGVLGTIPASLYEAAEIDGATAPQKFRFITLPWVLRATVPVIITTFTFNFNNFGAIYFLTAGGPGYPIERIPETMRITGATPGQTDILISWIYKIAFANDPERYNLASVYSIIIFMIVGIFGIYNLSRMKNFWED